MTDLMRIYLKDVIGMASTIYGSRENMPITYNDLDKAYIWVRDRIALRSVSMQESTKERNIRDPDISDAR